MPTTVTKTVGPGKNYATLAAAITGEARNLVSANEICDLECYAMEDTTQVFVGGFTTDATRYVRIRAADRHDGTRDTSAYRLHASIDFQNAIEVDQDYTRIEGLQVKNPGVVGSGLSVGAVGVRITDTLVYDCGSNGIVGAVGHSVVMNNVAAMHNTGYGIGRNPVLTGSMIGYNCTSVNNGGAGFVGATDFGSVSTFKNCYSGGNSGVDYENTHGITLTTCFSEDGTAGSTTAAFSTNSGTRFLNITAGSEDVHHTGSSSLRHAGTDLTADGNWINPNGFVDIDGDARGSTWDVGVDQAPPDAVTNLLAPTVAGTAYTGHTLTATGGVWADAISTAGRWQRETGVGTGIYTDISSATSLTYVLQAADTLLRVRYLETATNVSGSTSVASDPVGPVGTSASLIAQLELATIFAVNLPRYEYVLQSADAGRHVKFVETATNLSGSTEAESAPYGIIGGAVSLIVGMTVQSDVTVEIPTVLLVDASFGPIMLLLSPYDRRS